MSVLFAATYPERTVAMVLVATFARVAWAPDYPLGTRPEVWERPAGADGRGLGQGRAARAPSRSRWPRMPPARHWWARFQRQASSPGAVVAVMRMVYEIDTRSILSAVRVPTLVLHRSEDRLVPVELPRYLAARIPGARFVELPGTDHFFFSGDADAYLDQIEEFLTGERHGATPDRVLATILFADIVGSTERAAQLGDSRWHAVLDALLRRRPAPARALSRPRGRFRGRRLLRRLRRPGARDPLRRGENVAGRCRKRRPEPRVAASGRAGLFSGQS